MRVEEVYCLLDYVAIGLYDSGVPLKNIACQRFSLDGLLLWLVSNTRIEIPKEDVGSVEWLEEVSKSLRRVSDLRDMYTLELQTVYCINQRVVL